MKLGLGLLITTVGVTMLGASVDPLFAFGFVLTLVGIAWLTS